MNNILASVEEIDEYFLRLQLVNIDNIKVKSLNTYEELESLIEGNIINLEIEGKYEIENKEFIETNSIYDLYIYRVKEEVIDEDDIVIKCPKELLNNRLECNIEDEEILIVLRLNIKITENINRLLKPYINRVVKLDKLQKYFLTDNIKDKYINNWNSSHDDTLSELESKINGNSNYESMMKILLKEYGIGIKTASTILNLKEPFKYTVYSKSLDEYLKALNLIEKSDNKKTDIDKYREYNQYMNKFIINTYRFKNGLTTLDKTVNSSENILDFINRVNFDIAKVFNIYEII